MSYSDVKRHIVKNAMSNYVRTFVASTVGLVTFRLLYQSFSKEEFGFWSLLWSVFGYGILLDFGFGFAAQKRVAELSVSQDWPQLSRVLSTILVFYTALAGTLATIIALVSGAIVPWFGIGPDHAAEFRIALIVFFAAIGLAFPMGIFPEILRGQQRIRLVNYLLTTAMILRLGVTWAALHWHWGFMSILLTSLFFSLAPDLAAAFFALRSLPGVKLSPRLFSLRVMRETFAFSVFAYISTATNMVLGKTDQLVLGATLGVVGVALYQAGNKVAEVFATFTKQLQDTLSPAAAHLHAMGDHHALRKLLVQGTRWSAMIATPLYLLCAFYLTELLQLLTGDSHIDSQTWWVGQTLLFWFYTSTLTHSVSKRVYMMTGHERTLMRMGLGEAGINLALSIALVLIFRNVLGVALGSLVPTLLYGWFYLWPWMARDAEMSGAALFRRTILSIWVACFPLVALLTAVAYVPALKFSKPWLTLLVHGAPAGLCAIALLWFYALTDEERANLSRRFPKFFRPDSQTQAA